MGNDDKKSKAEPELYYPPNRLASRIVDAEGPSLQDMEAEAAKRLAASEAEYAQVLETTIDRMKANFAADLSSNERHRKLFEDAHDIKGQAPLFGYPLVANVAICICAVLLEAPEKFSNHEDLVQLHLDALQWAFDNQNSKELAPEKDALVQTLRSAVEKNELKKR